MQTTIPSAKSNPANDGNYGERIRLERARRSLTQEKLAEMTGLSTRTIQRLECGETPSADTLLLLATAFRMDPDDLSPAKLQTTFPDPIAERSLRGMIGICAACSLLVVVLFAINGNFALLPQTGDDPIAIMPYIMTPVCVFMWIALPFSVLTGLAIKDNTLLVSHYGWAGRYDLAKATGIVRYPTFGKGGINVANIIFLLSSLLAQSEGGRKRKVSHFITDPDKAVIVEFGKRVLIVSPSNPDDFVEAVRRAVREYCDGRELPVPAFMVDSPTCPGDYSAIIKGEREKHSWTQEELGEKTGLSTRTIQRLEKGTPPSLETLRRLAYCFGIPMNGMDMQPLQRSFRAAWPKNRPLTRETILILNVYLLAATALCVMTTTAKWAMLACNIMSIYLIVNAYESVSGFSVRNGRLFVHRNAFRLARKYDLAKLTHIEIDPQAMMGALPLTYPFNFFSPVCHSPLHGMFRAFVTDRANCVVMEFGKKTIVISPDNPQAFVEAVREELRVMNRNETSSSKLPYHAVTRTLPCGTGPEKGHMP